MLENKQSQAAGKGDLKSEECAQTIGASWYRLCPKTRPQSRIPQSPSQKAKPSMETSCLRSQEKKPLHHRETVGGIPERRV